jgi:hypothetical protein
MASDHETRRSGAVFKEEEALSTTSARFGMSSELAPRTWDLRLSSSDACPRGRGGSFEAIGTTVWFLRSTSPVLGRASHILGSRSYALGRTPQVVGNDRPCLEARSVVAVFRDTHDPSHETRKSVRHAAGEMLPARATRPRTRRAPYRSVPPRLPASPPRLCRTQWLWPKLFDGQGNVGRRKPSFVTAGSNGSRESS